MIVGIDLGGSKAAVALLDGPHLRTKIFVSRALNRARTLAEVSFMVNEYVGTLDRAQIFVENPLIGKGVQASLRVAECYGAVISGLFRTTSDESTIHGVAVGTWKKDVTGKGNAAKGSVASWLDENHKGYSEQCQADQDLVDAVCIALYGVEVQSRVDVMAADRSSQ